MSDVAKTVLSVGAAVIVPFAAPAIAGSIGLSGAIASATGSAVVGGTVGSALSGAVLGGITAEATGGDFERGAIFGAVGGGIGGYGQAVATTGPNAGLSGGAPPNVRGVGPAGASAARGTAATAGSSLARGPSSNVSLTGNPMSTPTQSFAGTGYTPPVTQSQAAQELGLSAGSMPGSVPAGTEAVAGGNNFMEAVRSVPGEIAERFSDPEALADLTLRAGGIIAQMGITGALSTADIDSSAPEIRDLNEDERRLLDAQLQDLNELRDRNEEAFRQRLQTAQDILGEARYFDPEAFGMDAYADVQRREGLRQREAAREAALSPGRAGLSAEDVRRGQLGGAIGAQTAYSQAADQAQQQRLRTYQAGLSALPDPGQFSTINESSTMAGMINQARTSRREAENVIKQDRQRQQAGYGEIFESISEPFMRS